MDITLYIGRILRRLQNAGFILYSYQDLQDSSVSTYKNSEVDFVNTGPKLQPPIEQQAQAEDREKSCRPKIIINHITRKRSCGHKKIKHTEVSAHSRH